MIVCVIAAAACVAAEPSDDADQQQDSETTSEDETGSEFTGEFESLIDHALWEQAEADVDPLAGHRPTQIDCGIAGWYLENGYLEIDTNFCNYLALRQPSRAPIHEGAKLRLGFYHFDLVAPEQALAHVALLVDGQLLWEQEVEIPGPAMVYEHEFVAPHSAPAGAELVFHLHNHGQNTWTLQSISAEQ